MNPASPEQRDRVLEVRRKHTERQRKDLALARRKERRHLRAIVAGRPIQDTTIITRTEHDAETAGTSPAMRETMRRLGLTTDLDAPARPEPPL